MNYVVVIIEVPDIIMNFDIFYFSAVRDFWNTIFYKRNGAFEKIPVKAAGLQINVMFHAKVLLVDCD